MYLFFPLLSIDCRTLPVFIFSPPFASFKAQHLSCKGVILLCIVESHTPFLGTPGVSMSFLLHILACSHGIWKPSAFLIVMLIRVLIAFMICTFIHGITGFINFINRAHCGKNNSCLANYHQLECPGGCFVKELSTIPKQNCLPQEQMNRLS